MIVEAQSIGIDGISGATMTSNGIKSAVEAALKKAGYDVAKYQKASAPKKDMSYFPVMGSFTLPEKWDETYDVVVVGAGFAGMAAAYSAGEAGAVVAVGQPTLRFTVTIESRVALADKVSEY